MGKTSNIFARVEPEIKEQAESVLNQLGIPMSSAVKRTLEIGKLTKEQLDVEIAKGVDDIENGRVYSAEEVLKEMHRSYGI